MHVDFKKIVGASLGSFLEWYDFSLYAFLAPYLSRIFFPQNDPNALIFTYIIFAATYLARPLGGLIFGHFVDKFSRKKVLVTAMAMMGLSTTLIGFVPSFQSIGWWAPSLLLLMRSIQGFSIGGDYTESLVYLIEHGENGGRGKLGCYINIAASLGALIAPIFIFFSKAIFKGNIWWSIGWRTPFYFGIVAAILGIYIRLKFGESPQFEKVLKEKKQSESPLKELFATQKAAMLRCLIFAIYVGVAFYIILIFLNTWYIHDKGMSLDTALLISFVTLILNIVGTYIGGALSDRIGRKKTFFIATVVIGICTIPAFILIQKVLVPQHMLFWILVVEGALLCFNGMISGVLPATMVEMLPVHVRGSAIAFSYNLAIGIFGGTSPIVCLLLLKKTHSIIGPAIYVVLTALLAFFTLFTFKETYNEPLRES